MQIRGAEYAIFVEVGKISGLFKYGRRETFSKIRVMNETDVQIVINLGRQYSGLVNVDMNEGTHIPLVVMVIC